MTIGVELQHTAMLYGLICMIASLVTAAIHVFLMPAKPKRFNPFA